METQVCVVSATQQQYNTWVEQMASHKTFIPPTWLSSLPSPCAILEHSWENGLVSIVVGLHPSPLR